MTDSFLTKWERVIRNTTPVSAGRGDDVYEESVARVGAALHEVFLQYDYNFNDIFLRLLAETAVRAAVGHVGSPKP